MVRRCATELGYTLVAAEAQPARSSIAGSVVRLVETGDRYAVTAGGMDESIVACVNPHMRDAGLVGVSKKHKVAREQFSSSYRGSMSRLQGGGVWELHAQTQSGIKNKARAVVGSRPGSAPDIRVSHPAHDSSQKRRARWWIFNRRILARTWRPVVGVSSVNPAALTVLELDPQPVPTECQYATCRAAFGHGDTFQPRSGHQQKISILSHDSASRRRNSGRTL